MSAVLQIIGDFDIIEDDIMNRRFGKRLGYDENRHSGRMVWPLDKRQPGDDLGRAGLSEATPPRAFRRQHPYDAKVAAGFCHGLDDPRGALMRDVRDREAEMEPAAVTHRGVTARNIGMHAVVRLDKGKGRDNDPPNTFDGIERQEAPMA